MRDATPADYVWLYSTTDYQADGLQCAREALPWVQSLLRLNSALDVGCGRGHFVQWLRRQGVDAWGDDPATGQMAPMRRYDLVTAWDVLEHLREDHGIRMLISMMSRTRRHLAFSICTDSDVRPIGGEEVQLHLNRAGPAWWLAALRRLAPLAVVAWHPCLQSTRHWFAVELP